jgi:monoamine oxidase
MYDIVIIGSGIAGLYSAYNIQKMSPNTSFVVLEKHKQWIGGRTSNETFYGTQVVTGAGVGRKKDKLLIKLLKELNVPYKEFTFKPYYSINPMNITKTIDFLKDKYKPGTFKEFAKPILGKDYNHFLTSVGYTDFENEDAYEHFENESETSQKGSEVVGVSESNLLQSTMSDNMAEPDISPDMINQLVSETERKSVPLSSGTKSSVTEFNENLS